MTIKLSDLILDVQVSLSDIPEEYASDEQLYDSLKMAKGYIDSIKDADVLESLESQAIRTFATYLAYANYTSLVERTRGEVSQASAIKISLLQRIAVGFLRRITTLKINDDTTVDQTAAGRKPAAVGLTVSVVSGNLI